jgi:hypothetical protein
VPVISVQMHPKSCPQLGSIRVIHGWKLGAVGIAPSAVVAVDNPSGLSPVVGSRRYLYPGVVVPKHTTGMLFAPPAVCPVWI